MADKKKKQSSKKQTDKSSKMKRAEDLKNPKLPKGTKIPKGSDRTLISKEGNIIMTSNYIDISGKKKKTAAKKTTAKATSKSAVKATKSAKPKTAPKQVKKTVKKSEAAKATKKVKVLKPDRNYENSTDGDEKIIVLNGKKARKQTRSGRKQLKRVANNGGYTAWDGRTGKTFASEKEARDYAADVLLRTGELIPVTRTQRTVTHTFKAESRADK